MPLISSDILHRVPVCVWQFLMLLLSIGHISATASRLPTYCKCYRNNDQHHFEYVHFDTLKHTPTHSWSKYTHRHYVTHCVVRHSRQNHNQIILPQTISADCKIAHTEIINSKKRGFFVWFIWKRSYTSIHPSIHFPLNSIQACGMTGASPTCHWARSWVHSGQVTSSTHALNK